MPSITDLPLDWLRRKATLQEFERLELERKATVFELPVEKVIAKFCDRPFGDMTDDLRAFAKKMDNGDELWFFSAPDHLSALKLGYQGFAIVRAGKIRDSFVTLMT